MQSTPILQISSGVGSWSQRVLLVTAHPDDESMFFAPTLSLLLHRRADIHLLCLTNGEEPSKRIFFSELVSTQVMEMGSVRCESWSS